MSNRNLAIPLEDQINKLREIESPEGTLAFYLNQAVERFIHDNRCYARCSKNIQVTLLLYSILPVSHIKSLSGDPFPVSGGMGNTPMQRRG